jgi:DNA replication protein DnaC
VNTITKQENLEGLLKSLYLGSFVRHYRDFAKKAEREKIDHIEYLYQLSHVESSERHVRRTERLIQQAKLPPGKQLSNFEFNRVPDLSRALVNELAEGEFLDRNENLLLFGKPGRGKTHLVVALAREWCMRGRRTLHLKSSALIEELLKAKAQLKLNALIKRYDKYEALIIDDISYIPQTREETDILFTLLAERYEKRSIIVTSNLAFSGWGEIFKDQMTTAAAIDRIVHHATILELVGKSYRADVAEQRTEKGKKIKATAREACG